MALIVALLSQFRGGLRIVARGEHDETARAAHSIAYSRDLSQAILIKPMEVFDDNDERSFSAHRDNEFKRRRLDPKPSI
jgi:hypothetical protein